MDKRLKDRNWIVADENGEAKSWMAAQVAVLMDLRDELKNLNAVLKCPNFLDIPKRLKKIDRNTSRKRKQKTLR